MQPESRSSCQIQTLPRCSSTCEKTGESVTTAFTLKAILCPYKWVSLINFFFLFCNRLPDVPLIPVMLSPSVLRDCLKSPSRALFKECVGLFLMGVFRRWQPGCFIKSVSYLCVNILYLKLLQGFLFLFFSFVVVVVVHCKGL